MNLHVHDVVCSISLIPSEFFPGNKATRLCECTSSYLSCRVKVIPRASAKSGTVTGVFAGAVVVRGQDWRWSDQDGTVACSK